MNDQMNELVQFSPFAGGLYQQTVPGQASRKVEHENDVHAGDGEDRSMYAYAPVSGCPDPKQCQVLMVLRDDDTQESAQKLLTDLKLQSLAESEHFLVLFPNRQRGGWNYREDATADNDMDFLGRCFGVLRGSSLGVNGFNGMIYYISVCEDASALLMTMAAKKPLNVPAMMIGSFPKEYVIPNDALNIETAAWVSQNAAAVQYLKCANGVTAEYYADEVTEYCGNHANCRLFTTQRPIDAETVAMAWDRFFSVTRRWQNDTYGTYQKRTFFTARGFTAHVKDTSLGCNDGFAHTWYEYIPPHLRGTQEKVPLVFYFHGVNCVPLYGAEQSGWHDIADRENLIIIYPAPAQNKAWNIFNDPSMPSDFEFVMALIAHIQQVHPIDTERIYATGFSMGAMMTHAITACYPEVFAGAAPCNGFDFAYFKTPAKVLQSVVRGTNTAALQEQSAQKIMADARRAAMDYRMPMFQNAGYDDATIGLWPIKSGMDDIRCLTIAHWMDLNHIAPMCMDENTLSGIAADESFYEDPDERFYHQRWHSRDSGSPVLYELLIAKRMPHAIVHEQIEFAWEFLKRFRRKTDGSLGITG